MKALYWKPHNLPRIILLGFCLFVLAGLYRVETHKEMKYQPYYKEKLAASQLTEEAYAVIRQERIAKDIPIIKSLDPQLSGLIGRQITPITSDSSQLQVKQTTVNPNTAAIFVQWLQSLKVKPGDVVAVNMTGSFPALDIAMLSAIKTLQLKPIITYSAAASQFGANIPRFSWVDMYSDLVKRNVFDFPVWGVSLGGRHDNGYNMDPEGISILQKTIKRNKYTFIDSKDTVDGINKRMGIYEENSGGQPIVAFINVGGSVAAIGLKRVSDNPAFHRKPHTLETGIVDKLPIYLMNTDSVAVRFLKQGIPVVNVHNINDTLVEHYKLPPYPRSAVKVGTGLMYYELEYNTWLALGVLILDIIVFIVIALFSKKYMIRYKY